MLRTNPIFIRNLLKSEKIDLADLEDLYYATCGKFKQLRTDLDLRLSNGFQNPDDEFFIMPDNALKMRMPINAGQFNRYLCGRNDFLFGDELIKALERAILPEDGDLQTDLTDGKCIVNHPDTDNYSDQGSYANIPSEACNWPLGSDRICKTCSVPPGIIFPSLSEKHIKTKPHAGRRMAHVSTMLVKMGFPTIAETASMYATKRAAGSSPLSSNTLYQNSPDSKPTKDSPEYRGTDGFVPNTNTNTITASAATQTEDIFPIILPSMSIWAQDLITPPPEVNPLPDVPPAYWENPEQFKIVPINRGRYPEPMTVQDCIEELRLREKEIKMQKKLANPRRSWYNFWKRGSRPSRR